MKPKIWLRIACLFILIHLLGHAVGHATWDKPEDPYFFPFAAAMSLGAGILIFLGIFRMGNPSTEDRL